MHASFCCQVKEIVNTMYKFVKFQFTQTMLLYLHERMERKEIKMVNFNLVLSLLAITSLTNIKTTDAVTPRDVSSIRFLVSVNDTWGSCLATVATPPLKPGVKHNYTNAIHVAKCDHGPLDYNIMTSYDGNSQMTVDVVFHSSVIEDAGPPECTIPWNGTYLVPTPKKMDLSLLPGCSIKDSREGYHVTYYWFYILEWTFG
ncbi:hypothetical protein KUTeg_018261 [Tegillarca granosa]|uniref:Uncharacterized protein n=1 Tax=Tegillarca granosa TaxID=220873 RepID=A0ABQ9EN63_TEGGR|nr:hypothetical protein KUTeg_018261 [Tegillarca granosa]